MSNTVDQHIQRIRPLISPAVLYEELPATPLIDALVDDSRRGIEAVLSGNDQRLLVIVGPCSVHDPAAAVDYAQQLRDQTHHLDDRLLIIMRVYFEKPRTVVGWKGLINDPDIDGSYRINHCLRHALKLLLDVAAFCLPSGTEFLDSTFVQYYSYFIILGAICSRTS